MGCLKTRETFNKPHTHKKKGKKSLKYAKLLGSYREILNTHYKTSLITSD